MSTPKLILADHLDPSAIVLRSVARFYSVIMIVSANNFYLHNGYDTLIVLSGDTEEASAEHLLEVAAMDSTYVGALLNNVEDALEIYSVWQKKPVSVMESFYNDLRRKQL